MRQVKFNMFLHPNEPPQRIFWYIVRQIEMEPSKIGHKTYLVKLCPIFHGSASSCLTIYQKILWEGSLGCKKLMNFTCLTMKLHNHHYVVVIVKINIFVSKGWCQSWFQGQGWSPFTSLGSSSWSCKMFEDPFEFQINTQMEWKRCRTWVPRINSISK